MAEEFLQAVIAFRCFQCFLVDFSFCRVEDVFILPKFDKSPGMWDSNFLSGRGAAATSTRGGHRLVQG